jgi:hypothetical protein
MRIKMSATAAMLTSTPSKIPAITPPEIPPLFFPPPPLLALALAPPLFVAVPIEIVAAGVDESALSLRQSASVDAPTVRTLDVPPFRPAESVRAMRREVEDLMGGVNVYESAELVGGVMVTAWPPGMKACVGGEWGEGDEGEGLRRWWQVGRRRCSPILGMVWEWEVSEEDGKWGIGAVVKVVVGIVGENCMEEKERRDVGGGSRREMHWGTKEKRRMEGNVGVRNDQKMTDSLALSQRSIQLKIKSNARIRRIAGIPRNRRSYREQIGYASWCKAGCVWEGHDELLAFFEWDGDIEGLSAGGGWEGGVALRTTGLLWLGGERG